GGGERCGGRWPAEGCAGRLDTGQPAGFWCCDEDVSAARGRYRDGRLTEVGSNTSAMSGRRPRRGRQGRPSAVRPSNTIKPGSWGALPLLDFATVGELHDRYVEATGSPEIAPDHQIDQTGKDWYFSVGVSALRCILHGLAISRVPQVSSILDLPCGHGRVARHLRAAFPGVPIAFSDLNRSGVDFCSSLFDGIGIYSEPDL